MKYSSSLKKTPEFDLVYKSGHSKANRSFVMYVRRNDTELNHFGFSVSKKVGNSVVRHHLVRLLREAYRLHEDEFVRGIDFVVVARAGAKDISFKETERDLLHLAFLQGILC